MTDITIAFGNEISLTRDKKTGSELYVRLSTSFADEQLRELRGAPLAVFLCRALHSDARGYTFVGNRTIQKETGYSEVTPANRFLCQKGYLSMARLVDDHEQFRGWISRIFLPVEEGFTTALVKNGVKVPVKVKFTEVGKMPSSEKVQGRTNPDLTITSKYRTTTSLVSKETIDDSVVNLTPHKKILPLNRLVSLLEKKLGTKIVNYGKQAKAWKMMERAGYTEEQVRRTILYMADQDDFFSEKGFDLMTVANNIARYKAEAERRRLND